MKRSPARDQPIPDQHPILVGIARVFTDIVSPPIMFAALGVAAGLAGPSGSHGPLAAIVYAIFIAGLPLGLIIALHRAGRVSDLHMSGPGERRLPYLIGFISSAAAWAILSLMGASPEMRALAICSTFGLGALGLIDTHWLISNHAASITTVALYAGYVFGAPVGWSLSPLIVLVFAARLFLERHTVAQLLAGVAVGATPVLLLGWLGHLG